MLTNSPSAEYVCPNEVFKENNIHFSKQSLLILIGIVLLSFTVVRTNAADYVTAGSGNWSSLSTWKVNNKTATSLPTSSDDILIQSGDIITVDKNAACESIVMSSGLSCKLIIPRNIELSVREEVVIKNASADDSVKNTIIDIQGKMTIEGDLMIGGGTDNQGASVIINGTYDNGIYYPGKLYVKGTIGYINLNSNLYINDGSILSIGGNLNVGTFLNANTTVPPLSTINFNGITAQIIPSDFTYGNVVVSNTTEAKLNGPLTSGQLKGNLLVRAGGILNNNGYAISGSNKNFTVADSAKFIISGTSSFPSGFNFTLSPLGAVEYAGNNQVIAGQTYGKLVFANSNNSKTLGGNLTIQTELDLGNNSLSLESYNLTIGKDGTISNASPTSYINQNGSGKLIREAIGAGGISGEVLFPIGTPTSYTPAYLTNTGPSNSFSIKVTDNVKDNANNAVTTNVVNKTWHITQETNNGQANASLKLQWNPTDETQFFDRAHAGISRYQNGNWQGPAAYAAANGSNPYSLTIANLSSFSDFAVGDINSSISSTSPLPVELVYFKATKKGESALLEWETATEKNNQGFEIQLSADGKNFERLAFVESQNPNSHTAQRYAYTDARQSKTGLWYYRIKQTDIDGTVAFYGPKVIDFGKNKEFVTVYPNPFTKEFQLNLETTTPTEASITLQDLSGKTVLETKEKLIQGHNQFQIKIDDKYAAGLYLLTVKVNAKVSTARLIKQ